VGIITPKDRKL